MNTRILSSVFLAINTTFAWKMDFALINQKCLIEHDTISRTSAIDAYTDNVVGGNSSLLSAGPNQNSCELFSNYISPKFSFILNPISDSLKNKGIKAFSGITLFPEMYEYSLFDDFYNYARNLGLRENTQFRVQAAIPKNHKAILEYSSSKDYDYNNPPRYELLGEDTLKTYTFFASDFKRNNIPKPADATYDLTDQSSLHFFFESDSLKQGSDTVILQLESVEAIGAQANQPIECGFNRYYQTINFPSIPDHYLDDSAFSPYTETRQWIVLSYGNGIKVFNTDTLYNSAWLYSNTPKICSFEQNKLKLNKTGICSIDADQPGSCSYVRANTETKYFAVLDSHKKSQKIYIDSIPDQLTINHSISFRYNIDSKLKLDTLISKDKWVCKVENDSIIFLYDGICSLTAIQNGNDSTNPVIAHVQFNVSRGPVNFDFEPIADQYQSDSTYNITFRKSAPVNIVSYSRTPEICSISGEKIRFVKSGICSISAYTNGNSIYLSTDVITRNFNILDNNSSGIHFSKAPDQRLQIFDLKGHSIGNGSLNNTSDVLGSGIYFLQDGNHSKKHIYIKSE